ncbi:hypothetical protein CANARDRAFT_28160 [[Candida] arabinofermentans NRRL YB-2248]|uniref:Manganese/iron superoxide dismutase C-terminal domain-containing protein n=1 Tax=[Candida] arabinofermentans NRRL YB-2248 TaxID=983967 RepID=A0A1E4T0V7_9ASCO|nr:hypothetical protein CANARDRAFT_28160 [[Candida] arabinofermentans NRRL YB-2248]
MFKILKRSIHTVPRLTNFNQFHKNGIKGLMTPLQFESAWTSYQKYLTLQLSLNTVGTRYETMSPLSILLTSGKRSMDGLIYHYASLCHSNHLFIEQLKDSSSSTSDIKLNSQLMKIIIEQFGSVDEFKNEFLYQCDTLSGNGFIYLIENEFKKLEIISSNNDGTPYLYSRNQSLELNGPIGLKDYELILNNKIKLNLNEKDHSLPLLVCNVWENMYIEDYGICGKSDYLENFWNCINWEVVNNRYFNNYER